jgi:hypothetical protein
MVIFWHDRIYSNRAGIGEREFPDRLSNFEWEVWEPVKILRPLRFTDLERRGSDVELN